jgi:glycosyltransferase involved in cell wall biosynthesis
MQLLRHDEMRTEMGIKGSEYVSRYFNWKTIIRKLSALVEYVAGKDKR